MLASTRLCPALVICNDYVSPKYPSTLLTWLQFKPVTIYFYLLLVCIVRIASRLASVANYEYCMIDSANKISTWCRSLSTDICSTVGPASLPSGWDRARAACRSSICLCCCIAVSRIASRILTWLKTKLLIFIFETIAYTLWLTIANLKSSLAYNQIVNLHKVI